ncbi:MAG: DHH family phosphoesterase [Clostridia bacterium]|nr:DHH family phosphoesterase [Clostridia bacterium]
MNFRDILKNNPFTVAIILLATLISGVTFIFSKPIAVVELVIVIAFSVLAIKWIGHESARKKEMLRSFESYLRESGDVSDSVTSFPFPFLLVDNNGTVEWFNARFHELLDGAEVKNGDLISRFFPDCKKIIEANDFSVFEIKTANKEYTVYPARIDEKLISLYFTEDTALKEIRREYNVSRPVVILINIDSLEQTEDILAHADYYSVVSDVEKEITKWLVDNNCIFRKFADGKFLALTESRYFDAILKNKFSILDKVRLYRFGEEDVDITLSVGVGKESSFALCEVSARQALDLARGRGGDQAVVKVGDKYEFFGGTTGRKEKRGKIKSRIVSAALNEYIEKCSSVFVMGHTFSDFDAVGAAVGVCAIARACSKRAYVVVNKKNSLAMPLINRLEREYGKLSFISPERAQELFEEDSLLVITDTMRSQLVEAPSLLDRAGSVVLIDHHRKTVDHIDSADLEFHEPYASSACEMVTELVQYSPAKVRLSAFEAEALLAGIILDTKNYTLRVGVRTFEAAAYLKDCKADTVAVKQYFSGSVEDNVSISRLITNATFYKRYAVAVADEETVVSRLITSKAADELLNIAGVDASFVVCTANGTVYISARSLGKVNVQLIMEKFGGGGHQSMAACQLPDERIDSAVEKLNNAINEYFNDN